MKTLQGIENILERVAERHHTSAEEVRREIAAALQAGYNSLQGQVGWSELPFWDGCPEPEEFLLYIAEHGI